MPFRKSVLSLAVLLLASAPLGFTQSNPFPLVNNPLVPASVAVGGASFTLTVNGAGFVSGSVVNWNGTPLTTAFVSGSQLTATVPASDIGQEIVASVTVASPGPGGGTSNVELFQASFSTISVAVMGSAIPGTLDAYAIVSGDFNGDGKPDLAGATLNYISDGFVQVVINRGDGTFQNPVQYSTNIDPLSLATGDFNGDGKLDLAVANSCGTDPNCQTAGTVSILLGNGDGTFAPAVNYTCVNNAHWVAVGDFNGDGKLDLVVGGNGGISVFLGNGNGTFQQPTRGHLINSSSAE